MHALPILRYPWQNLPAGPPHFPLRHLGYPHKELFAVITCEPDEALAPLLIYKQQIILYVQFVAIYTRHMVMPFLSAIPYQACLSDVRGKSQLPQRPRSVRCRRPRNSRPRVLYLLSGIRAHLFRCWQWHTSRRARPPVSKRTKG